MAAVTGHSAAERRGRPGLAALLLTLGILIGLFVVPAARNATRERGSGAGMAPAVVYSQPTAVAADPLPDVSARAFAVYDATSGDFLASRGLDLELPVASITKLMTAAVTLAHGDLDRSVVIPPVPTDRGESVAGLQVGETLTRRQLLALLLIPSAGDAAEALAVTGGTTRPGFVDEMNARARGLGLTRTWYANPTGLDAPGQHSTARDVVRLAASLLRSATVREIVRRPSARLHGRVLPATNALLDRGLGIDGIKTGHTDEAGWCIVVSAVHRGHRIVIAVLGAGSASRRDTAVKGLLSWAQAADR